MDIVDFNNRWLAAWTARDPHAIVSFYDDNLVYYDGTVPNGLEGKAAFLTYVEQFCESGPQISFRADQVWRIEGGFSGRWLGLMKTPQGTTRLRGFDLCLVRNGLITHNELYTHALNETPSV